MNHKCPPYAPYLMKLICETVKDQGDLLETSEAHTLGTIVKKAAHLEGVSFAAHAARPHVRTSASSRQMVKEKVSKLPWEQRVIIGGLVQNHKESYAAYEQGRRLSKKVDDLKGKMMDFFNDARVQEGLAEWPSSPHRSGTSSHTIPYEEWNNDAINRGDFEDVCSTYKQNLKGKQPAHVEEEQ